MHKYITYRDIDKNGNLGYFVLQKAFPHFVGYIADNPNYRAILKVPIPNTTLFVCFNGTLRGNFIPSYRNVEQEIVDVYVDMAKWYYENRILANPSKYKKWILNDKQNDN